LTGIAAGGSVCVKNKSHAFVQKIGLERSTGCQAGVNNALHVRGNVRNGKKWNEIPKNIEK
jgi:hypothetical protein